MWWSIAILWALIQISWRFAPKCAPTSHTCAHSWYNVRVCVYNLWARIYARIRMKFDTYNYNIVIDHHIEFHVDPSFWCGDICKTILVFLNCWFSMYFTYLPNYAPPKSSEMDNCWIIIIFFWKLDIKMYISNKGEDTCLSLYVAF